MIKQQVVSKIFDKDIKDNLNNSPIWKECKHLHELTDDERESGEYTLYNIKFEGLTPVQVLSMKPIN